MQHILPSKEKLMLITCSIVTALLILGYTFRDTISDWKESVKAKVRKWVHEKVVDRAIEGDSAKTSVGFLSVLVQFLDDHFLKPSDEILNDDLVHSEEEEEENRAGNEEDGDGEEEEEGEDEEGEDEEEEGEDEEGEEEGEDEEEEEEEEVRGAEPVNGPEEDEEDYRIY